MTSSIVKDSKLASQGLRQIEWAEKHMPVLMQIRARFEKEKPFKGVNVSACLHVTKETAVLAKTLVAGGAKLHLSASNPLSTQDDVAAALDSIGIPTFAIKGMDNETYWKCLNACVDVKPHVTIDDGCDLVNLLHTKRTELIKDVIAGQEETTTGVVRLKAMAKDKALKYSVVAVNDTPTKHLMDNWYGTAQSTLDGIIRGTNELIAGKTLVVVGYGHCGKGLASRADGLGAKVIVVDINPVECLRAAFEGYQVMTMQEAASKGDIFVTVTGNKHVIRKEHFEVMKDGAVVCNSGHFDIELNLKDLEGLTKSTREVRPLVDEHTLKTGKRVIVLGQGRLVNLACAEGHPSEVMDLSFADQALTCEWIVKNKANFKEVKVYDVPNEIDQNVATLKCKAMQLGVDKLTAEQVAYMNEWKEGTN